MRGPFLSSHFEHMRTLESKFFTREKENISQEVENF